MQPLDIWTAVLDVIDGFWSNHWQKHLVNKDSLVWCPMRQNAVAMHLVKVPLTLREAQESLNLDRFVMCEHVTKHLNHQSCLVGIPVFKEKRAPTLLAIFHEFALVACGAYSEVQDVVKRVKHEMWQH